MHRPGAGDPALQALVQDETVLRRRDRQHVERHHLPTVGEKGARSVLIRPSQHRNPPEPGGPGLLGGPAPQDPPGIGKGHLFSGFPQGRPTWSEVLGLPGPSGEGDLAGVAAKPGGTARQERGGHPVLKPQGKEHRSLGPFPETPGPPGAVGKEGLLRGEEPLDGEGQRSFTRPW